MTTYCPKLKEQYAEAIKIKDTFPFILEKFGRDRNPEPAREFKSRYEKLCEEIRRLAGLQKENVQISPERAEKILGEDYFGPETIEKTFEFKLKPEQIPPIPFSLTEIERAKELGHFLILRIDRVPGKIRKEVPLNLVQMKKKFGWLLDDKFGPPKKKFGAPRPGWALVSKDLVAPGLADYAQALESLIHHLKEKIYKNRELSPRYSLYSLAVEGWEKTKKEIAKPGTFDLTENRVAHAVNLLIKQFLLPSPEELIYDLAVYYKINESYRPLSLKNWRYHNFWSNKPYGDKVITIGIANRDEITPNTNPPEDKNLVIISRRF